MAKAKMRPGTCKCIKGNRKLCKSKRGKVEFKGKCRR